MYKSVDADLITEHVPAGGKASEKSLPILPLVQQLCQALATENINYCHWKSNDALDRSASGDNDLDLLVSRADIPRFTGILCQLGFKQAVATKEKQLYGVLDYFGYDVAADRWVHVHAHYQLILGHDMTKNYRLPIERAYLKSAIQGELFRVPAPEFEFIVFVIRMLLKHFTWDVTTGREGKIKTTEQRELAYLQNQINQDLVHDILKQHLSYINIDLFDDFVRVLQSKHPLWVRMKIGQRLLVKLRANARHSLLNDIWMKQWRRLVLAIRRRIFKSSSKYRLKSGGAMIAIVGGDGAGKSTAVDGLYDWLSKHFETTKLHLGKPEWSWTTKVVRGILKIGNFLGLYPGASSFRKTLNQKSLISPAYPYLLREICTSRDRFWTYLKARRFAANGGLVILDRLPVAEIRLMDGPLTAEFLDRQANARKPGQLISLHRDSWFAKILINLEERYYRQIAPPELLFVLRLDPEIAVKRKINEDADYVRERSTEIYELNWEHTDAFVMDASKSKSNVLAKLKILIWSEL